MKNKNIFILSIIALLMILGACNYGQARRKERNISRSNYDKMLENISMEKYYVSKREDYLKSLKDSCFCKELSQEMIIAVLDNYTAKNNIQILNIKFSKGDLAPPDESGIEMLEADAGISDSCQFVGVTIEFKSCFNLLLDFIDDINEYENDISIIDVGIISWDDDRVYVVVDMKFYAVPIIQLV